MAFSFSGCSALLRRYTGHEVWALGLVAQPAGDIVRHGLTAPVRWLATDQLWSFLADPFILPEADGSLSLFAERMNYVTGKGTIWSGRLRPENPTNWADLQPTIAAEAHLSFPFAFHHQGRACLLCESWEAGGASLYTRHDDGWRFEALISPAGRPVIDPVLYKDSDCWWLFCTHPGQGAMSELHLYHAESLYGEWTPHSKYPVVVGSDRARPAGPLFTVDGMLIRPAQDCSQTYGGGVTLNRIIEWSAMTYREEVIRRLDPIAPYSKGLHSFCPAGEWTIIDGKYWRHHPLDLPRKLLSGWRGAIRRSRLRRGV